MTTTGLDTLGAIRTRGYWSVIIRPAAFNAQHVAKRTELFPVVERLSAHLRGWPFPYAHSDSNHGEKIGGIDWVGFEHRWDRYIEVWRLYQSGQFIDYRCIPNDWSSERIEAAPNVLYVGDVVNSYSEIFEFAARLASSSVGAPSIHIEVTLHGLQRKVLAFGDPIREFGRDHRASIDEYPLAWDISTPKLSSQVRELALIASQQLFQQFDWDAAPEILRGYQDKLRW